MESFHYIHGSKRVHACLSINKPVHACLSINRPQGNKEEIAKIPQFHSEKDSRVFLNGSYIGRNLKLHSRWVPTFDLTSLNKTWEINRFLAPDDATIHYQFCYGNKCVCKYIRVFPKVDHSGNNAGLYWSKINSAKSYL